VYAFVRVYTDADGERHIELMEPDEFPLTKEEADEKLERLRELGFVQRDAASLTACAE
jgi:hypothetical protein